MENVYSLSYINYTSIDFKNNIGEFQDLILWWDSSEFTKLLVDLTWVFIPGPFAIWQGDLRPVTSHLQNPVSSSLKW